MTSYNYQFVYHHPSGREFVVATAGSSHEEAIHILESRGYNRNRLEFKSKQSQEELRQRLDESNPSQPAPAPPPEKPPVKPDPTTFTASFRLQPNAGQIFYRSVNEGWDDRMASKSVTSGDRLVIWVEPNEGYRFKEWLRDNQFVSSNNPHTTLPISQNTVFTAVLETIPKQDEPEPEAPPEDVPEQPPSPEEPVEGAPAPPLVEKVKEKTKKALLDPIIMPILGIIGIVLAIVIFVWDRRKKK